MAGDSPSLGGHRRERDPRLWGALLGNDPRRREQVARTIQALESETEYARQLVATLPDLQSWQRANAGDALALLGDPRFTGPYYLSEMIFIPAGRAVLGDRNYPNEHPVHVVEVEGFALAQYPITQAAYAHFVAQTGYRPPRNWRRKRPHPVSLNQPVTHVSARDAEAFCAWLSRETGYNYRLPTEAEWVLAARGAESRRTYPWGDQYEAGCANSWGRDPLRRVTAVGLFPEGDAPFGHADISGNVWEWCSSLYWPYPYRRDDGREDPGTDRDKRVMHGGSWRSRPSSVRCSARQGEPPTDSFAVVGFRVARDG